MSYLLDSTKKVIKEKFRDELDEDFDNLSIEKMKIFFSELGMEEELEKYNLDGKEFLKKDIKELNVNSLQNKKLHALKEYLNDLLLNSQKKNNQRNLERTIVTGYDHKINKKSEINASKLNNKEIIEDKKKNIENSEDKLYLLSQDGDNFKINLKNEFIVSQKDSNFPFKDNLNIDEENHCTFNIYSSNLFIKPNQENSTFLLINYLETISLINGLKLNFMNNQFSILNYTDNSISYKNNTKASIKFEMKDKTTFLLKLTDNENIIIAQIEDIKNDLLLGTISFNKMANALYLTSLIQDELIALEIPKKLFKLKHGKLIRIGEIDKFLIANKFEPKNLPNYLNKLNHICNEEELKKRQCKVCADDINSYIDIFI